MTAKLLTKLHLRFLSLKGGCTGSSESILVEIPQRWKSHVTANLLFQSISGSHVYFTYLDSVDEVVGWCYGLDYNHSLCRGFCLL